MATNTNSVDAPIDRSSEAADVALMGTDGDGISGFVVDPDSDRDDDEQPRAPEVEHKCNTPRGRGRTFLVVALAVFAATTGLLLSYWPQNHQLSLTSVLNSDGEIVVEMGTDIAMLVVADPSALARRAGEELEWWVGKRALVSRINEGRGIFVRLGMDNYYDVHLHRPPSRLAGDAVRANVRCSSGVLYVGGDIEKAALFRGQSFDGTILTCPSGAYQLDIRRHANTIDISISTTSASGNRFREIPFLE